MKTLIVLWLTVLLFSTSVSAVEIPSESLPSNATFECMEYTETLISDILDKVQNGLGFSDAQAEARQRFFNLVVSGQSNGYTLRYINDIGWIRLMSLYGYAENPQIAWDKICDIQDVRDDAMRLIRDFV